MCDSMHPARSTFVAEPRIETLTRPTQLGAKSLTEVYFDSSKGPVRLSTATAAVGAAHAAVRAMRSKRAAPPFGRQDAWIVGGPRG